MAEKTSTRKVVVVNYDPQWPFMFEAEADRIRDVFGKEIMAIHHIGSTAVPGLKAKPIIDIMPLVRDIEAVDKFNDKMIALCYEPRGEFGIPGRRYFQKGGDDRTHHVHIFQFDSSDVERHLTFRDYLRQHKDDAKRYGELKESLAERFSDDIEAYCDGKNEFIKNLEQKAIEWHRKRI